MSHSQTSMLDAPSATTPLDRTWIRVDLDAVDHNVTQIRRKLSKGTSLMAVVKANAYGHGIGPVARAALYSGAQRLGVAHVAEGLELRAQGITAPILLLGACAEADYALGIQNNLSFAISSAAEARALAVRARREFMHGRLPGRVKVHLLVDTGMGRSGASPDDATAIGLSIQDEDTLDLEGVFTHFSSAEDPDPTANLEQYYIFYCVLDEMNRRGVRPRIRHAANSAATAFFKDSHLDMVRCGAMMHGMRWWTDEQEKKAGLGDLNLKPSLSWHTRIVHIAKRPVGWTVGYGRTFKAERETILATLPIGYRDGYPRSLSNRGEVLICGQRAPVVGIVSMDFTVVDITDLCWTSGGKAEVGTDVTLLGDSLCGKGKISVEEFATRAQTIPYVVTTTLPTSAPRVYTGKICQELAGMAESEMEVRSAVTSRFFQSKPQAEAPNLLRRLA